MAEEEGQALAWAPWGVCLCSDVITLMVLVLMPNGVTQEQGTHLHLGSPNMVPGRMACVDKQLILSHRVLSRPAFTVPSAPPGELVRQEPSLHSPRVGETASQLPTAPRYF